MGFRGAAIGGWIGATFGGPLGAILGAALGHEVEKRFSRAGSAAGRRSRAASGYAGASANRRAMVFCASVAAMFAKLAKSDGRVVRTEIDAIENAFARLGFSKAARDYAIEVFRRAKDDRHSVYSYADEFAGVVDSLETREMLYGLLWDIACADGTVSPEELRILRGLPARLKIGAAWFEYFRRERLGGGSRRGETPVRNALDEAYAILGVPKSAGDETVRKAYRELAKRYHPDRLRAEGMPEEMIGKATATMAKINGAWDAIKAARKLRK